jgi:hypothetical protein
MRNSMNSGNCCSSCDLSARLARPCCTCCSAADLVCRVHVDRHRGNRCEGDCIGEEHTELSKGGCAVLHATAKNC